MKMNEVLMAEDVLRPYGITLYYSITRAANI